MIFSDFNDSIICYWDWALGNQNWVLSSEKPKALPSLFVEYSQVEEPGWASAKTPFKTKLTMHSLSTRHTSGLYRRLLCFGQSVETLNTNGNTRARNKRRVKTEILASSKAHCKYSLRFSDQSSSQIAFKKFLCEFYTRTNCMPKSSGRATVASETQQIPESL